MDDLRVGLRYYDRDGQSLNMLEWAKLFEDHGYKIVDQTEVGGYTISTVWLGLDHSTFVGFPLIFETMVFRREDDDSNAFDGVQERYTTEQQARDGHDDIVRKVRDE